MKKNKLPIIILATLISALGIYGQKTVNQKGRVREITYSASEQITPIKNVIINYRHGQQEWSRKSKDDGSFTISFPESSTFYINDIIPPSSARYFLVSPVRQQWSSPFLYTPNLFEVILVNDTKQKEEENKILSNYKSNYIKEKTQLFQQIEMLKMELQDLRETTGSEKERLQTTLDSLQSAYDRIPKEFNMSSLQEEVRRLAAIDYASLTPEEARKVDLKKSGDWENYLKLARESQMSDKTMDSLGNEYARKNAQAQELLESSASDLAQLEKGTQANRDLFEAFLNTHRNDSAAFYLKKIFLQPVVNRPYDYTRAADFYSRQMADQQMADSILKAGMEWYKGRGDDEAMITLLLKLAETNAQAGHIAEAARLFGEAEKIVEGSRLADTRSEWLVNNKAGTFYSSTGEVKKGLGMMERCKATLDRYELTDVEKFDFLGSYASMLVEMNRNEEAEAILTGMMEELRPMTGNLLYKEIYANAIYTHGKLDYSRCRFGDAMEHYNHAMQLFDEIFERPVNSTVPVKEALAEYDFYSGNIAAAFESIDGIESLIGETYDDPTVPLCRLRMQKADYLLKMARFDEARKLYEEQARTIDASFARQPVNAINAYLGLAEIHQIYSEYDKAETILERCDSIIIATFPGESLHRTRVLSAMADLRAQSQRLPEAVALTEKALEITDATAGKSSAAYAAILLKLSSLKATLGFYGGAEKLLGEVREIVAPYIDAAPMFRFELKEAEIGLDAQMARLDDMKKSIDVAIEDSERIFGPSHPTAISFRANLASYYGKTGELDKATKIYEECMELSKTHYGDVETQSLPYYHALLELYQMAGANDKAVECASRIKDISSASYGEESLIALRAAYNLLTMTSGHHRYNEKTAALDRMIETAEKSGMGNGLVKYNFLIEKANLLMENGDVNEALSLYRTTLEWNDRTIGHRHPNTINLLTGMGRCHSILLDESKAIECSQEALALATDFYGPGNIYTINALLTHIQLLRSSMRNSEALELAEPIIGSAAIENLAPYRVTALMQVAQLYADLEEWGKAEAALQSALETHLEIFKNENFKTIEIYLQFAAIKNSRKEFSEALRWLDKAEKLADEFCEPTDNAVLAIELQKINCLTSSYKIGESIEMARAIELRLSEETQPFDTRTLVSYQTLIGVYTSTGEYAHAGELASMLYQRALENQSSDHTTLSLRYQMADLAYKKMNYSEALEIMEEVVEKAKRLDSSATLRNVERGKAEILHALGRFDEALKLLQPYEKAIFESGDELSPSLLNISLLLSNLYKSTGNPALSKRHSSLISGHYRKAYGETSPFYAFHMADRIFSGMEEKTLEENFTALGTLLSNVEATLGERSPEAAYLRFKISNYRYSNLPTADNEGELLESLRELTAVSGDKHTVEFEANQLVANGYHNVGRVEEAAKYLKRNIELLERLNGGESSQATDIVRLAYANNLIMSGGYDEAEKILAEYYDRTVSAYGEQSPVLLNCLEYMFNLYTARMDNILHNDEEDADETLERSEAIIESLNIDNPALLSGLIYNKGFRAMKLGEDDEAEEFFTEYKRTIEKYYGKESPYLIKYYLSIAQLMMNRAMQTQEPEYFAGAEEASLNAVELSEKVFGEDAPMNVQPYYYLAGIHSIKFNYFKEEESLDKEIELLEKALDICDYHLGKISPSHCGILMMLHSAYFLKGEPEKSKNTFKRLANATGKIWGAESFNMYSVVAGRINLLEEYAKRLEEEKLYDAACGWIEEAIELIDGAPNPETYEMRRDSLRIRLEDIELRKKFAETGN